VKYANLLLFPKKCLINISEYWILHTPHSPRTLAYFLILQVIKTEIFLSLLPKCWVRWKSPTLANDKVWEIYQTETANNFPELHTVGHYRTFNICWQITVKVITALSKYSFTGCGHYWNYAFLGFSDKKVPINMGCIVKVYGTIEIFHSH
jgi:hypothetical protein